MASPIRPLALLLALTVSGFDPYPVPAKGAPDGAGLKTVNCPKDYEERFNPGPISPGPLRFEKVVCLDFQSSPYSVTDATLSPDGAAVARWHAGAPAPVEIVQLGRSGRVDIPNRVTFRSFAFSGPGSSPDALAWSSNSLALWAVRQKTMSPSGFALAGLEPIAIGRNGTVRPLPALRHSAGPLDGLQWIGGDGRALALFGARGGYYRPEHADLEPTLAMIDAGLGRVLDSVPARTLPKLRRRVDEYGLMVGGATATPLADGRIQAVIQFGGWGERPPGAPSGKAPIRNPPFWLSWTQGEPPRDRPSPYPDDGFNYLLLAPGGERLLVIRPLEPHGLQIHCHIPPCPQPPPPKPVTGSIAELLEVSSGRVLWRLGLRVDRFWNQDVLPTVSGDGRFALIALPPDGNRLPIALVDMRSGRIVQTIAPAHVGSYTYSLGFTADGQYAWVGIGHSMHFYRFGRS